MHGKVGRAKRRKAGCIGDSAWVASPVCFSVYKSSDFLLVCVSVNNHVRSRERREDRAAPRTLRKYDKALTFADLRSSEYGNFGDEIPSGTA